MYYDNQVQEHTRSPQTDKTSFKIPVCNKFGKAADALKVNTKESDAKDSPASHKEFPSPLNHIRLSAAAQSPPDFDPDDPFGDDMDVAEMSKFGKRSVLKDRHYLNAWKQFALHAGDQLENLVAGSLATEQVDIMLANYLKTRYNKNTLKQVTF